MTIEEIKNEYAKEQGFENWRDLTNEFVLNHIDSKNNTAFKLFNNHENAIIQLIQDELKMKICMGKLIPLPLNSDYDDLEKEILNTENIK